MLKKLVDFVEVAQPLGGFNFFRFVAGGFHKILHIVSEGEELHAICGVANDFSVLDVALLRLRGKNCSRLASDINLFSVELDVLI